MLAEAAKNDPDGFHHDTCVCGIAIIRAKYIDSGWYHATGERGCRAALYHVSPDAWAKSKTTTKARPRKRGCFFLRDVSIPGIRVTRRG